MIHQVPDYNSFFCLVKFTP
uniref:Uncharacterized protein n=1 Tax=Arundo donax TaxID=35708 RepID=A0A0A8ZGW9_ARUDO